MAVSRSVSELGFKSTYRWRRTVLQSVRHRAGVSQLRHGGTMGHRGICGFQPSQATVLFSPAGTSAKGNRARSCFWSWKAACGSWSAFSMPAREFMSSINRLSRRSSASSPSEFSCKSRTPTGRLITMASKDRAPPMSPGGRVVGDAGFNRDFDSVSGGSLGRRSGSRRVEGRAGLA